MHETMAVQFCWFWVDINTTIQGISSNHLLFLVRFVGRFLWCGVVVEAVWSHIKGHPVMSYRIGGTQGTDDCGARWYEEAPQSIFIFVKISIRHVTIIQYFLHTLIGYSWRACEHLQDAYLVGWVAECVVRFVTELYRNCVAIQLVISLDNNNPCTAAQTLPDYVCTRHLVGRQWKFIDGATVHTTWGNNLL